MNRTKLCDRVLPDYTRGEEIMNMVTHITGGGLALLITLACLGRSLGHRSMLGLIGSAVYGFTMIALYTVSSVYHGLKCGTGKKVMQVIDHCAIYFLICGTYTPILLAAFIPRCPAIGWAMLCLQWGLAIVAATLTAIDLHRFRIVEMVCYIAMGWCIVLFLPQFLRTVEPGCFGWLLAGGIAYTVGAVLYGIGSKRHWMHSVFHIFVVLGSVLQFVAIYGYIL